MNKIAVVVDNKDILCASMDYVERMLANGISFEEAERRFSVSLENATKAFYIDETDTHAIINMNTASRRLEALQTIRTIHSLIQEN